MKPRRRPCAVDSGEVSALAPHPPAIGATRNPSWLWLTSSTPLIARLQGTAPPGALGTYSFFVSTTMTASTGPVIVYQVFTLYVMPAP